MVAVAEERVDLVAWLSAHGKSSYDQPALEHAGRGSVSRMCVILWVTQTGRQCSARLVMLQAKSGLSVLSRPRW